MRIRWERFARALREAFATPEQEIVCSECLNLIAALVDAQLADEDPAARYPEAWAHLQRCPDCRREYEALLELMRLVEADALPEPETYPTFELPVVTEAEPEGPPRSWLERARETMARIADQVQQGQAYAQAVVQARVEGGVEQITFTLTPARVVAQPAGERGPAPSRYFYALEDLGLEITVGMRAFAPGHKTVRGQVLLRDGDVRELAGLPVSLVDGDGLSLTATVDEMGGFTFARVPPGRYRLSLELGEGKVVWLEGVEV